MKCTIIEIHHPNIHVRPYIKVRVGRGQIHKLDAFRRPYLYERLSVGDTVEAVHQTNNPYLVPTQ